MPLTPFCEAIRMYAAFCKGKESEEVHLNVLYLLRP